MQRNAIAIHSGSQVLLDFAEHRSMPELCELSVTGIALILARQLPTVDGNAKSYYRMDSVGTLVNTYLLDSQQSMRRSKSTCLAYMEVQTRRGRHMCTANSRCGHPGAIANSTVHRAVGMSDYFGWGTRLGLVNRYGCFAHPGYVVARCLGRFLQSCHKSWC